MKKIWPLLCLCVVVTVDAVASTTTLSGTSGAYTLSGTDTYGWGGTFVKGANFLSDNGLNKIIGTGVAIKAGMYASAGDHGRAALAGLIGLGFAFLPQIVDGVYGAMI